MAGNIGFSLSKICSDKPISDGTIYSFTPIAQYNYLLSINVVGANAMQALFFVGFENQWNVLVKELASKFMRSNSSIDIIYNADTSAIDIKFNISSAGAQFGTIRALRV